MYNAIIVDDDIDIANGLSKKINCRELDFNVVATFSNGYDALDFLSKNNDIDVLISDIEMPYIDGFQLAQKVKKHYSEISVILVMGYSAYEYAKKAIDLDVEALIKKPVIMEELVVVLSKIQHSLDKKRANENYVKKLQSYHQTSLPVVRDAVLYSVVKNSVNELLTEEKLEYLDINLKYDNFLIVCLELCVSKGDCDASLLDDYVIGAREISSGVLKNVTPFEVFNIYEKNIFIIKFNDFDSTYLTNIDIAFNEIVKRINTELNIACSIGISSLCNDITKLTEAYNQAKQAIDYSIFMGVNKIYYYEDRVNQTETAISEVDLQALDHNITHGNLESVYAYLDTIKNKIRKLGNINDYYLTVTQILNDILKRSENIADIYEHFGVNGDFYYRVINNKNLDDTFDTLKKICAYIKEANIKALSNNAQHNAHEALGYIEQNYRSPLISLESVASHVNLSVSYICYLLKKEKNTTFVKYLTELRIEEAKTLLKNTNMKISDIAEKIGYGDAYYFSHIFKKITGMSPKEFRINNK